MSAGQPPLDSPEIRRLTPVIEPGYTFGTVTDKISSIVLTRPASLGWFAGFTQFNTDAPFNRGNWTRFILSKRRKQTC